MRRWRRRDVGDRRAVAHTGLKNGAAVVASERRGQGRRSSQPHSAFHRIQITLFFFRTRTRRRGPNQVGATGRQVRRHRRARVLLGGARSDQGPAERAVCVVNRGAPVVACGTPTAPRRDSRRCGQPRPLHRQQPAAIAVRARLSITAGNSTALRSQPASAAVAQGRRRPGHGTSSRRPPSSPTAATSQLAPTRGPSFGPRQGAWTTAHACQAPLRHEPSGIRSICAPTLSDRRALTSEPSVVY